jgi:hypothetical protein
LDATDQPTITVHVPMTFTVRGGRKTILSDAVPAPPQPRIDNALLKALARAHRWRRIRPPIRLFRLVLESHNGRVLVPIPKRSASP